MSVPEQQLFVLAERALTSVIEQIEDDQWDLPVPSEAAMSGGTVRDMVIAHGRDDQWVGHVLAGRTIEDGKALFPEQPPGLGLGADLKAGWRAISDRAVADALSLDDWDRPVHLSFGSIGDFTAQEYLQQIIAYRGLQAWDLARVLSVPYTLPEDLVTGMLAMLAPVAEQWRAWGVFGPAVPVPGDSSARDQLLGLTGRRP
jgi:uncharacterized protein (TIGR03086 family)